MRKIFIFAVLLLIAMFGTRVVFAQENPEDVAKKHGITFPIAELNGCANYAECRTYCEDPVNQATCIAFAKKKGFYREENVESRKDSLIADAKKELGCDSEASCRSFCSQEANFEKCSSFAKKNNLTGGHVDNPEEKRFLEKAKEVLGCDSPSSCMNFCQNEANRQECSDFAKQMGFKGGEQRVGPGGCNSEETCKTFCSDQNNYQICSQYGSAGGGKFSGPGGCNSEESCRSYCQSHPQECGYGGSSEGIKHDPAEMCSKTPNCSWKNNTCECGSYGGEFGQQAKDYADFCRQNPSKCGQGQSAGFENSQKREEFEKFCRENPEKCGAQRQPSGSTTPEGGYNPPPKKGYSTDPVTGCAQAGGAWVNGSCQFSGSSGSTGSTGSTPPPPPPPSSSGGSSPDPATMCAQTSGCSWTGSTCQCLQVKGVATTPSFLELIYNFLSGR